MGRGAVVQGAEAEQRVRPGRPDWLERKRQERRRQQERREPGLGWQSAQTPPAEEVEARAAPVGAAVEEPGAVELVLPALGK